MGSGLNVFVVLLWLVDDIMGLWFVGVLYFIVVFDVIE